jgi:AP-3 complex subunit beta
MRFSNEIEFAVLSTIRTIVKIDPEIFAPFAFEFFAENRNPYFVKLLKLNILVSLATATNIDRLLREFSFYTTQGDKKFVATTIQAIGQCALRIPEVTERCMTQLLQLLLSKDETVVAESVVVIKTLLQVPSTRNDKERFVDIIKKLARLFSKVTSTKALSSIIWVVGEYVSALEYYAPDILRQCAKDFLTYNDPVKLQILNMASKLYLHNPSTMSMIVQYILNLAKFDHSYDVRGKSRLLRLILFNSKGESKIMLKNAKILFLSTKPHAITNTDSFDSVSPFDIGTLSHIINKTITGYLPLPEWSTEPTDPSLRVAYDPSPIGLGYGPSSISSNDYHPSHILPFKDPLFRNSDEYFEESYLIGSSEWGDEGEWEDEAEWDEKGEWDDTEWFVEYGEDTFCDGENGEMNKWYDENEFLWDESDEWFNGELEYDTQVCSEEWDITDENHKEAYESVFN